MPSCFITRSLSRSYISRSSDYHHQAHIISRQPPSIKKSPPARSSKPTTVNHSHLRQWQTHPINPHQPRSGLLKTKTRSPTTPMLPTTTTTPTYHTTASLMAVDRHATQITALEVHDKSRDGGIDRQFHEVMFGNIRTRHLGV